MTERSERELMMVLARGEIDRRARSGGGCARRRYNESCSGAPVTRQPGRHRALGFRWAYPKRFRKAMTTFAGDSRHAGVWAARIYFRATLSRRTS
ncbi:hypothetical protein [Microtetraspora malaysiensis]|uniref:hypothetical protein n=1 Tax=Microtetraspora malaysiensis TaxID=161358 RepID=UPI003D92A58F